VAIASGGTAGTLDWVENFRVCSNEFNTPRILVCPSDKGYEEKDDFAMLTAENDVSFFYGKDATELRPQTILAGDRNVFGGGGGYDPTWNLGWDSSIDATWEETMHAERGNIALSDGSVQQTTSISLRDQISEALHAGSTNVVFSKPRGVL
jgi:hypothetical protein